MDVNTMFNVNLSGTQNVTFPRGEGVAEIPQGSQGPKGGEGAMMDLQDVQNFLYMLIGGDLKVKNHDKSTGDSVNVLA